MARGAITKRAKQKDETRELILAAATRLLAEHGYAALRVAAVAQEAGVSLGGQLHHFPSKDSLVIAVIERLSARVMDLAEQDAARDKGDRDPLVLVAESAVRFYSTPEFLIYLDIFLSVRRHAPIGDTAADLLVAQRRATEDLWLPHLTARSIAEGDARSTIRTLWGLSRGLAISSDCPDGRSDTDATMRYALQAIQLYLSGRDAPGGGAPILPKGDAATRAIPAIDEESGEEIR